VSRFSRFLAAAGAGLTLVTSSAQGQSLGSGAGCSGDTFLFCASWSLTYVNTTSIRLDVTNTSQNAPANNTGSAFTQIAIGGVTLADPTGMNAVTGWQFDANVNGFNGFPLLQNQFGTITTNGINNALLDGNSLSFTFNFGASIGTYAAAQTATSAFQIAIHDQGAPTNCTSSKGVLNGQTGATLSTTGSCGGGGTSSTVPEPSTYALMAAGLAALGFVAHRRRQNA
jgi:hypothetical protein